MFYFKEILICKIVYIYTHVIAWLTLQKIRMALQLCQLGFTSANWTHRSHWKQCARAVQDLRNVVHILLFVELVLSRTLTRLETNFMRFHVCASKSVCCCASRVREGRPILLLANFYINCVVCCSTVSQSN